MRRFAFLSWVLLALSIAGCGGGDGGGEGTKPVSTTANQPRALVEIYCKGSGPEATGADCPRRVRFADICKQDTPARQVAITAYIKKTGDYGICD